MKLFSSRVETDAEDIALLYDEVGYHTVEEGIAPVERSYPGRSICPVGHATGTTDIVPDGFLEELEETLEVLADSEAVRALVEAREASARGDVVRGAEAVRALLDERRD